jgi:hypothetical protein
MILDEVRDQSWMMPGFCCVDHRLHGCAPTIGKISSGPCSGSGGKRDYKHSTMLSFNQTDRESSLFLQYWGHNKRGPPDKVLRNKELVMAGLYVN